ncbi:hypothetical protein [Amycolatopsis taiwanensis]|nr:hypothetical protein [Amycolatopsis taiwanensis]
MSDKAPADEHVWRVTEQLAHEFAGIVSRADLEDVVLSARRDLEGQVVPAALDEMLHRLAHYRLTRLTASTPGSPVQSPARP